jgi:CubicO group peptidase (beta-lactamase class C family)
MDRSSHSSALEAIQARAKESESHELIIWKDGQTLVEWKSDKLINIFSITKSIVSLAFGIAYDKGMIPTFDLRVSDIYKEWKGTDKEEITLQHLLSHTSGIYSPSGHKDNWEEIFHSEDLVALVLASTLEHKPGSRCIYNNRATAFLPSLLQEIVQKPFIDFVAEHLFNLLGIEKFKWKQDKKGNYFGGSESELSASDLYKIGMMILNDGKWKDQKIVSSKWIQKMGEASQEFHPRVGLLWWKSPHVWASFDDPNLLV